MSPDKIATLVSRGLAIKTEISSLTIELKAIEKQLEQAGLDGEQIPLQDAEREGKQFLAIGDKKIVPIRFESDQIIASFAPDSPTHKTLQEIAGTHLSKFFADTRVFKRLQDDGNEFRKLARTAFEPDTFARFIHACIARKKDGIPKSKTVIAWDDAKPIDQVPA